MLLSRLHSRPRANTCLESIGARQNTLALESIERREKAARSANSLRGLRSPVLSATSICTSQLRARCHFANYKPRRTRLDRSVEGIVERTEVENNSREGENSRERERERVRQIRKEDSLRRVLRDAYSRRVRGTSSPVHSCRLMHRGPRLS